MRWLAGAVLSGLVLLLGPGCEVYEYSLRTLVSPAGEVSRDVRFEAKETQREKPADGEKDVEGEPERPEFTAQLILPDRERFDRYELERGHFVGSWHSSGVIHSDFCFASPGSDRESLPTAHNEGEVFVREYGLVRSYNYAETFHDFHERWEWERNADALIDEAAKLALEVIEEDFGTDYNLDGLKQYMRDGLIPFAKRYKTRLWQHAFTRGGTLQVGGLTQDPPEAWELEASHDLMQLGLADDLGRLDDLYDLSGPQGAALAARKVGQLLAGTSEPTAELQGKLQDYFSESGLFLTSFQKHIVKRYGSMESFTERLISQCYSFSLQSHMIFPKHGFTAAVSLPGVVSHVSPEPESVEKGNGLTDITWEFTEWDFFPDGVHLIAISFVPVEEKQKEVFGAIVLDEAKKMAGYAELFRRLNLEQRAALQRTFEACAAQGTTGPLEELAAVVEEQVDRLHEAEPFSEELREAENLANLLRFLTELGGAGLHPQHK